MSITRTLAAALAIGALLAPAAQAQPADTHVSTPQAAAHARKHQDLRSADAQYAARVEQTQDLRSADAQDAARHPREAAAARTLSGPPTWPANAQPITRASAADTADGSGVDWTPIAIGVAASLLAMAGLIGLNSRRMRRLHRPRAIA